MIARIKGWISSEATDCLRVLLLTAVLMLWMAAAAAGFMVLLAQGSADPLVVDLELTALLGLAAGAGARLILRKRTLLLRLAAASAGVLLAMGLTGYFTGGSFGLVLDQSQADAGAVRLLVAMVLAWMFLLAFRRARGQVSRDHEYGASSTGARKGSPERRMKPRSDSRSLAGRTSYRESLRKKLSGIWQGFRAAPQKRKRSTGKPEKSRRQGSRSRTVVKTRKTGAAGGRASTQKIYPKKKGRRKSSAAGRTKTEDSRVLALRRRKKSRSAAGRISLNGSEEHRCPYCLENVERNDPRGVKECPVCRTWHHADCWAVTGTCQVPHKHE